MSWSELRREAERLEGALYSLRRTVAARDEEAWTAAALASGSLERLADRLRALEKLERQGTIVDERQ